MSLTSQNARKPLLIAFLILLLGGLGTLLGLMMRSKKAKASSALDGSEYEQYKPWVIAQARHESANFSAPVYRNNNNPFGMKVPERRPFLGTQGTKAPDGGYYARYRDDYQAWEDLILWYRYTKFPTDLDTVDQYVTALKQRGYFQAPYDLYLNAVEAWLKKYPNGDN